TLQLQVQPNETFSILPRNCFAVNLKTGERYSLTDEMGCAIDDQRFPQWTRTSNSSAIAIFRTFKWPDSTVIRFQCDCVACLGCPQPDCSRGAVARRKLRMRKTRHTMEEERDEKKEEITGAAEVLHFSRSVVGSEGLTKSSIVSVADD
ncbi:hypothetical protein PFISCL1PPCAC_11314, partial [Pristionchus fissidentatus]